MATGAAILLDNEATAFSVTQTTKLPRNGACITATFIVQVTAITRTTGTLNVGVYWSPDGTVANGLKIAEVTGLTAAGTSNLALQSPFTGANQSIPIPNIALWTIVGDTTLVTGNIYAFMA